MNYSFENQSFECVDKDITKKAVIGTDFMFNWGEFKNEVDKLINIFQQINLPKSYPVIVYGHKQAHMIVAKTALLMYGAVYIPTDIIFPFERIKMMQAECNSDVLINCSENAEIENIFNVIIKLPKGEVVSKNIISNHSILNKIDKENLINYILFTSGSTGKPKGVPIAKRGILLFVNWIKQQFGISKNDVILNVSSLSFDFASLDEYLFLSLGSTIVMSSTDEIKNSTKLISKIIDEEVTIWLSTPSLVYLYLTEPRFNFKDLPLLNSFIFAGEALPLRTYKLLRERFPEAKIWNAYGPSEATNLTTYVELTDDLIDNYNLIPIGYPKPNSKIILDEIDNDGVGEICIIGEHLTPGYLNNPNLNDEKFFIINGERAYKSGDLGFFKDGLLFYAGRNDDMVKLHGYRIELDDISSTIKEINGVLNASTIGLKNKGETKKIVSFYTQKGDLSINKSSIIEYLNNHLPEYMHPSEIIELKEIPLNTSDKVDKKQLETIYISRSF
jgi:D-alanine--poly(phosphoribitol) ligase subunit 1